MGVGGGAHPAALAQPVAQPPVADSCRSNHQKDEEDADEGEEPTCSRHTKHYPGVCVRECVCACVSVSVCECVCG